MRKLGNRCTTDRVFPRRARKFILHSIRLTQGTKNKPDFYQTVIVSSCNSQV